MNIANEPIEIIHSIDGNANIIGVQNYIGAILIDRKSYVFGPPESVADVRHYFATILGLELLLAQITSV